MQDDSAYDVMLALNIKSSAIEIYHELTFMLQRGMEKKRFIECNTGCKVMVILKYLSVERIKLLERTRFHSEYDFVNHYLDDKRNSLERLFGEYFNEGKIRRLTFDNPVRLYMLHSKDTTNARFMKLMESA